MKVIKPVPSICNVIIYLLRTDKRDYTQDEFFFTQLLPQELRPKTMIGISQADKIEPLSRTRILSPEQQSNLERKKEQVCKLFPQVSKGNVLPFSTHNGYGVETLRQQIKCLLTAN